MSKCYCGSTGYDYGPCEYCIARKDTVYRREGREEGFREGVQSEEARRYWFEQASLALAFAASENLGMVEILPDLGGRYRMLAHECFNRGQALLDSLKSA